MGQYFSCCCEKKQLCEKLRATINAKCRSNCCITNDNHVDLSLVLCDTCKTNLISKLQEK